MGRDCKCFLLARAREDANTDISQVTLGDLAQPSLQSAPVSDAIPNGYPPLVNESVIACSAYSGQLPTCDRQRMFQRVLPVPHTDFRD